MITKEQIEKFWGTPEQWKELCLEVLKQGEESQELIKADWIVEQENGKICKVSPINRSIIQYENPFSFPTLVPFKLHHCRKY